ncbi:MAG: hypothetical protein ABEI53_00840 [Candidatus Magasanikbacteria bacterium]
MEFYLFDHNFKVAAFNNKEVDSLYLTSTLLKFTKGLISVFVPIYLYELGFPIWQILGFYALRSMYYLFFVHLSLGFLKKLSDKMMMSLGLPFLIVYFLGLNSLEGLSVLFFILPAAEALHMLLFWLGYHTDFTAASDTDHLGEEVGTRIMITNFTKFVTPFLGGLLIAYLNFHYLFLIASAILIISMIPLFFFPNRGMLTDLNLSKLWSYVTDKRILPFNFSALSYGSEKMTKIIIWPLFLFTVLGGTEQLGGVISAGLLAGGVMTYLIGKTADHREDISKKFVTGFTSGVSLTWIGKALLVGAAKAIPASVTHVVDNLFRRALIVNWRRKFYILSGRFKHPSAFVLSQEMLYHISRVIILPVFMLLAFSISTSSFFLISFLIASLLSVGFLGANQK